MSTEPHERPQDGDPYGVKKRGTLTRERVKNFNKITEMRKQGQTWEEVGEEWNVQGRTAWEFYDRELKTRAAKRDGRRSRFSRNKIQTGRGRTSERLGAYPDSSNPPTGAKSDLSLDEWTTTFCPGQTWEDVEYLSDLRKRIYNDFRLIVLMPRTSGKSRGCIAMIARYILEERRPVLAIVAGSTGGNRLFDGVVEVLTCEAVRQFYGDIATFNRHQKLIKLDDNIRPEGEIEPALRVAGRGSKDLIGSHPGLIIAEDIVQEDFVSGESNVRLCEWWDHVVLPMCSYEPGSETRVIVIGTRKSPTDFYQHVIDSELFGEALHKRAVEKTKGDWPTAKHLYKDKRGLYYVKPDEVDGEFETLGCPSWSLPILLALSVLNPRSFASNYQNDPLPGEGEVFDLAHWLEIEAVVGDPWLDFYIVCDPAHPSRHKRPGKYADYTAILVAAVWHDQLVIVDGVYERLKYDEIIEAMVRMTYKHYPHVTWLHADRDYETRLYEDVEKRFKEEGLHGLEPYISRENKLQKIEAMRVDFVAGKIVHWVDCPIKEHGKREYVMFDGTDSTATKKDDYLDGLSTLKTMLAHRLYPREYRPHDGETIAWTRIGDLFAGEKW